MADIVLVLCILMSAYFIRGITGFGSGLISVPLLALSQPLHFAIPLVLALDFTASVVLGSTNNKKANWNEIKILLPAGMIGACIGAFTFSWLFAMEGGFRLALFLFAGLLLDTKLQLAYVLGLFPMALGLAIGNRVHLDITSIGMLRVVGTLLVLSGSMLLLKVAI